jgi:hypothetical protein
MHAVGPHLPCFVAAGCAAHHVGADDLRQRGLSALIAGPASVHDSYGRAISCPEALAGSGRELDFGHARARRAPSITNSFSG